MKFSERHGHKKARESIQMESMDDALRNVIWNALTILVWKKAVESSGMYGGYYLPDSPDLNNLCHALWNNFFKKPIDELSTDWKKVLRELRAYFLDAEWYEVYDFIEFVANNYSGDRFRTQFCNACNLMLERENSGYRFIDGLITPITDDNELNSIDLALEEKGPVQTHLQRALELMSSRDNPDYRNSIKESISALESMVATTLKADSGTLGQLIKKLEDEIGLHPALKSAFSSLYGYTSDQDGIRHAILESENIQFEDAKFFLVACAAFINFIRSKLS